MDGSTPATQGRIFISYRRQETAYPAAWLFERVAAHFGREQVFKDVDSIKLGDDFAEVIANAVGSCDVLLALVGDRWLTVTDEDGRRRLDDPDDFVRLEIETALERNIRVIPVLFEGARLPRAGELPASLAKLVRRQALELSPSRFDTDIGKLLRVLETTLAEEQAGREEAAKAAREAEEQTRHEAEARAADAEERSRRDAEERKLGAIDTVAQELRSGSPSTVASVEGALRRLANDANHRVAQKAADILANWQAESKDRREAEAKAQWEEEAKAGEVPYSTELETPTKLNNESEGSRVWAGSSGAFRGKRLTAWLVTGSGLILVFGVLIAALIESKTDSDGSGSTATTQADGSGSTATTQADSEARSGVFTARRPWTLSITSHGYRCYTELLDENNERIGVRSGDADSYITSEEVAEQVTVPDLSKLSGTFHITGGRDCSYSVKDRNGKVTIRWS